MTAEVIELPSKWETGHGLCTKCFAASVQVVHAAAPALTECPECKQMAVRFATTREVMLIKERSNIERVLENPTQLRVEVYGGKETMAILSGLLVDGIVTSLLRERFRAIQATLMEAE